jgi:hypothetical protein
MTAFIPLMTAPISRIDLIYLADAPIYLADDRVYLAG